VLAAHRDMKLATIEDPNDYGFLCNTLRCAGFHCEGYLTAEALLKARRGREFDLVIVESGACNLAEQTSHSLLKQMLALNQPMLFVTSRRVDVDVALWLGMDYLVKPVSADVLVARVWALLSRPGSRNEDRSTQFGRYRFELDNHEVQVDDIPVRLTQKEYLLALLLFRNLSRPVSRVYIAEHVWPHDERINARTMTTHVSWIRSKLRLHPVFGYRLSPIYNYGYRLDQLQGVSRPLSSSVPVMSC
jgi:DNA-binding response OmpR family regulator